MLKKKSHYFKKYRHYASVSEGRGKLDSRNRSLKSRAGERFDLILFQVQCPASINQPNNAQKARHSCKSTLTRWPLQTSRQRGKESHYCQGLGACEDNHTCVNLCERCERKNLCTSTTHLHFFASNVAPAIDVI